MMADLQANIDRVEEQTMRLLEHLERRLVDLGVRVARLEQQILEQAKDRP